MGARAVSMTYIESNNLGDGRSRLDDRGGLGSADRINTEMDDNNEMNNAVTVGYISNQSEVQRDRSIGGEEIELCSETIECYPSGGNGCSAATRLLRR